MLLPPSTGLHAAPAFTTASATQPSDPLSNNSGGSGGSAGDADAVSAEVAAAVAETGAEVVRVHGGDTAFTAHKVAVAASRPAGYSGTVSGCLGNVAGRVATVGIVTDAATTPFIVIGGTAAVPKAHLDRLMRLARSPS